MSESANKERTTMIPQIARHQQEIAAKDAELDKLRVFLGDASPKSDALRRQFDAEIATLRATVDQQAETICQLQATLPELHDAIERQSAQIAALTQERDEEARAFKRAAKDRDICRQKRVDLEARCATLTAALEQKTKWADFLGNYLDWNHESHGSDMAWDEFIEKEHETPPVAGCECARCCATLAVAPQGGTPK